jgi:hypothetical protein
MGDRFAATCWSGYAPSRQEVSPEDSAPSRTRGHSMLCPLHDLRCGVACSCAVPGRRFIVTLRPLSISTEGE